MALPAHSSVPANEKPDAGRHSQAGFTGTAECDGFK